MRLRSGYQKCLTKSKSEEPPSTFGTTGARRKRIAETESSTSGSRVTKRRKLETRTANEDVTIEKEDPVRVDKENVSLEENRKDEDDTEGVMIDKEEDLSRVYEENQFSEEEQEESSDSNSSEANEDDAEDCVQLSDSIRMFPNRRISTHGEIYEGEIRSGILDARPIVLKLVENIPQSITEARILAKLNNHSHVLSQIHTGTFNFRLVDQIYIALDKCHHENLRDFVTNRKDRGFAFNLSRAIEIAEQMVDGVKYIHENRIIHKDLKPDNILFSLDQRLIKIADFGLSQEIESTSAEVFEEGQFGTNGFRPPESFGRGIISQKSDIFSLGVIFHFVLSNGEHAFGDDSDGWNYRVKNGIIDLSALLAPNIKTAQHLLKSMIEHKINDRPTIWQVSEHPFWTGNEVSCDFDYHCPESSKSLIPPTSEEPSFDIADVDVDQLLEHVKIIQFRDEVAAARNRLRSKHSDDDIIGDDIGFDSDDDIVYDSDNDIFFVSDDDIVYNSDDDLWTKTDAALSEQEKKNRMIRTRVSRARLDENIAKCSNWVMLNEFGEDLIRANLEKYLEDNDAGITAKTSGTTNVHIEHMVVNRDAPIVVGKLVNNRISRLEAPQQQMFDKDPDVWIPSQTSGTTNVHIEHMNVNRDVPIAGVGQHVDKGLHDWKLRSSK